MILTVTLNPAVDRTIYLNDLNLGHVNRVDSARQDAGGKGINVSKSIRALGRESRAFAVVGGQNGEYIAHYIKNLKIDLVAYMIDGETRQNVKIVDLALDQYTDINEPGPAVDAQTVQGIEKAILEQLTQNTVLVLSGSAAPGFDESIYRELIESAQKKGCKVILDADGPLLAEAIKAKPFLVKPNIHELERLVGYSLETPGAVVKAARKMIDVGVSQVVVSMGEEGALWVDKDRAFLIDSFKVEVRSTVGAGDAMVAGLAVAVEESIEPEAAMRLATACSAASVMAEGSDCGSLGNLYEESQKLMIQEIMEG